MSEKGGDRYFYNSGIFTMTQPRFKGKYRVESIRLPNKDYAANGWYLIAICTQNRAYFFGYVVAGEMQLSAVGKIAQQFWAEIPNHFAHTYIDAYVIMPNHVHGIVVIDRPHQDDHHPPNVERLHCNVSTQRDITQNRSSDVMRRMMSEISPKTGSLGAIARSYKSVVTRWCHQNGFDKFAWQPRRFYEHIIRADGSLNRIRQYIVNNPAQWTKDKENSANLWM